MKNSHVKCWWNWPLYSHFSSSLIDKDSSLKFSFEKRKLKMWKNYETFCLNGIFFANDVWLKKNFFLQIFKIEIYYFVWALKQSLETRLLNPLDQCFLNRWAKEICEWPPNLSHFVLNYNSIHNYYKFYKKPNFLAICKHQE